MFEFNNSYVNCFLSFTEPTQEIKNTLSDYKGGMYEITYPLLNLYLTTTKTFVAISAEVRSSVFRHVVVGRMESYTNRSDGEFLYSTNSYYDKIGYQHPNNEQGIVYYSRVNGDEYYYAQGIVGHAKPSRSSYKNFVAYNGELIVSYAGGGSDKKFISPPPVNVCKGSMNFNGRSPLNTHHLMFSRDNDDFMQPVFYCNELATIAIDNLTPADIVMDDWIVFPVITKLRDIRSNEVSTGNLGVAFKFK